MKSRKNKVFHDQVLTAVGQVISLRLKKKTVINDIPPFPAEN